MINTENMENFFLFQIQIFHNYKNHFDIITIAGLLEFSTIKDAIQLISNLQKSLKKMEELF
jgi:hypothetical protein